MTKREIDALVAKHAFGYRHYQFTRDNGSTFVMFMSADAMTGEYLKSRQAVEVESGDDLDNAPHYSTDPAASYAVLEAIERRGLELAFARELMAIVAPLRALPNQIAWRCAKATPLAVALAALRALGVQVD